MKCNCGGNMKSEIEIGGQSLAIEPWGHYYYRESNYLPVRITIVEKARPGFYRCVKGHLTKEEIQEKKLEPFLIHINKITL